MGAELQDIPAGHGVATFVPAGSSIKIVNTSGTQVIDTWAFALPSPPESAPDAGDKEEDDAPKTNGNAAESKKEAPKPTPKKAKGKKDGFPSQEEAEAATAKGMEADDSSSAAPAKSGWSSYVPSLSLYGGNKSEGEKKTVKENSRSWGQYFSAGKGFSNYVPGKDSLSAFAASHKRDPNASYIDQLSAFSRTPVGAAGVSVLSGQGYASSLYAGYNAFTGGDKGDMPAPMEYLSLPHTRASTGRLTPKKGDVLVSNLREPMLTVLEDTTGVHDTLLPACDPADYKNIGVDEWAEHGSCAENLVLALGELNERAGLKGPKGIGADVTVNSQPSSMHLFQNVSYTSSGGLSVDGPKVKKDDYIRFRAERDVVVVMSACPNEVSGINGKKIEDGHFVVEEDDEEVDVRAKLESASSQAPSKAAPARKAAPKKLSRPAAASQDSSSSPAASKPAASKPAASKPAASKPAASTKHTPIGTKKVPKTKPASSASKASAPAAASSSAAPSRSSPAASTPKRKDSSSTVPSNTKHAGETSTIAGTNSTSASTVGGSGEKKKPRKLTRKTD